MRKLFFTGRISCAAIIGVLALCFHVSNAWGLTASTTVDGGTLSWAVTQFTAPCGPTGSSDTYTQYGLGSFQFNYDGTTYPLNGVSSAYIQDGNQYGCPPSGPQPSALPIPLPSYFGDAHLEFTGESGGYGYATAVSTGTYDPAYKVVSILYAPPGNQSTQGYTVSTTNGTTSTIGDGFTYSQQLTFSAGIAGVLGGSASWGYSTGNSDSQAFTQSWTDATGYVNNDMGKSSLNPNASNVENHNLDLFLIWLNPQVAVVNDNSIGLPPFSAYK